MNLYETPRLVGEYLLLHYGSAAEVLGDMPGPVEATGFATRLVRELLVTPPANSRALDLGCAVGASSFELARSCSEVTGIDFSHAFIEAARILAETGGHSFEKSIEGTITEPTTVEVAPEIERTRCRFAQGDAMDLPAELREFDVVLAANLLCRLTDPMLLIRRLPELVRAGGQLLLTTPFTWLEEFTPKTHWIGGTPETGRSFEALQALLAPHFALERTTDLPFVIREHARKFQYGVACGSRWRRL